MIDQVQLDIVSSQLDHHSGLSHFEKGHGNAIQ